MERKGIEKMRAEIEAQMARMREPLFTSKVAHDAERYLNADLHLSSENWDTYATGYKIAGDNLVQYVIDNNLDQDFLVYPIGFLYRHYLELRLKELIFVSSALLDKDDEFRKNHNLLSLWKLARPNIESVWPEDKTKTYLDWLEERIKELSDLDPKSDAFRYPEKKKGEATLRGLLHINLKHLKEVFQGISDVLDSASTGMGEYLNSKNEMMAEYRAERRRQCDQY